MQNIDEVIMHRMILELKHKGMPFPRNAFVDVVFGGDRGTHRVRALENVIFSSGEEPQIETYSVTLHTVNIAGTKDTSEILENTMVPPE